MESLAWAGARQCTATSRSTGERCGRRSIPGGSVCVLHGGSIPAVQAAAKMRLLAMVEPVMAAFEEILEAWHRVTCTGCGHVDEHGVKCVGCGKPTGDPAPVIRIGQLVLDRSGFHPTLAVERVAPPPEPPYEDFTDDQLIEKLEAMLAEAIAERDFCTPAAPIDAGFEVREEEGGARSIPPGDSAKEPASD
jgi:hypothetical protein